MIEPIINRFRKKKPEEEKRSKSGGEKDEPLRPISEYKTLDPGFKEAALRERLSNLYLQLQDAWHERNLESLRPYLTDGFYNQNERQLAEKRRSHIIPCTERIAVLEVKLTGFYQEEGLDHIVVRLMTRLIDYEIFDPGESDSGKKAEPRVISGSKTQEKFMEYEWDLCRKTGVQTEGPDGNAVKTVTCPKCGAPLNINQTAQCPYCGSVVTVENEDWALNNIKGISQRTGQ
ncbi:MAG: TIM44-like domain-containing protein [Lachnospiraceae bacterium]|nr:TIM44-like domain-containing protein [Lachnospiraceae bacterium]